jgi:hypothetical protein
MPFLVPPAPMGLLCPQQVVQQMQCNGDGFQALSRHGILTFPSSKNRKWLLKWHNRLSRMNFLKIQDLARQGALQKANADCKHPICHSCQLRKAHCKPIASPTGLNQ